MGFYRECLGVVCKNASQHVVIGSSSSIGGDDVANDDDDDK